MRQQTSLTPDEVTRLLEAAKKDCTRNHLIIVLGFKHGLRCSEIAALKVTDVADGYLTVDRKKGSLKTTQALENLPGNPLQDEPRLIRKWLKERPADVSDALFPSRQGGHLDRTMIFKLFRRLALEAGLSPEKSHPHVLKHSLASILISQNAPLSEVRQRLGHKSLSSTLRYISTTDAQADRSTRKALMSAF